MDYKKEFHRLLNSSAMQGITLKKVQELTGLGYSSINNHKSKVESRWMSEEAAKQGLTIMEEYLQNPDRSTVITVAPNGGVEKITKGNVQRLIDDITVTRNKLIEERTQVEVHLQNLNTEIQELGITIQTLKKGNY